MSRADGTMDGLQSVVVLSAAINLVGLQLANWCCSSGGLLLSQYYPELLSAEGTLSLMLWGAAYLAAAHSLTWNRQPQPYIFLALALHKVFCTATWAWWLLYKPKPVAIPPWEASLEHMWAKNPAAALYFTAYGAADFVFACVFLHAAEAGFSAPPPPRKRRVTPTMTEMTLRALLYLGAFCTSCHIPLWVYPAATGGTSRLAVHYPQLFSHEGIASIALWGLLSIAAAQSLGGAQPQPWMFVALSLQHLFYFGCWAHWMSKRDGAPPYDAQFAMFFNLLGIFSMVYAAVTMLCAGKSFKRDWQLEAKRERRRREREVESTRRRCDDATASPPSVSPREEVEVDGVVSNANSGPRRRAAAAAAAAAGGGGGIAVPTE